ncbi:hypothetical protein TELCIR_10459 [Teladorsagia circumcincta]|uniref:Nuclear pore protein n=1 Tax=Teladorsagia circumcincta TaxID=45464 RepID=A0A2G9UC15_TELCI|nr:hypothetical protein TELCIR_10459 [Teladorsagia circumcincta]
MDSDLADSLENWLWFKLFAVKIDPHLTPIIYAEVQKNVSIDYGETYFMAAGTSEFHYYFTALWLSGQFERAIKGLKTPSGGDVFEMAVSRAVYLTGQAEAIIGSLGPDGKRTPALIDEYVDDCNYIISRVAHDTELGGDTTQAVKLYMLANAPVKAVELLCTELSDAIRVNRTKMNELRRLAEEFVSSQGDVRASVLSTLCIILDICTLIDLCESGLADKALSVSQQLRLIPLEADQVPVIVGEFHLIPQKVREVIPDLCLHLMRCMIDAIHASSTVNVRYSKQVKAIMLYAATVNYEFPQHITSKLLQLQASIAV